MAHLGNNLLSLNYTGRNKVLGSAVGCDLWITENIQPRAEIKVGLGNVFFLYLHEP